MVLELFGSFEYFLYFGFIDSLDVAQILFSGHNDTGNGAVASTFKFGNIGSVDTTLLEFLDFQERGGFDFYRDFLELFLGDFFLFLRLFSLLHGQ